MTDLDLTLTQTDELIADAKQKHPTISRELLEEAIPAAIDTLYDTRDKDGNMHSSGAAVAIEALRLAQKHENMRDLRQDLKNIKLPSTTSVTTELIDNLAEVIYGSIKALNKQHDLPDVEDQVRLAAKSVLAVVGWPALSPSAKSLLAFMLYEDDEVYSVFAGDGVWDELRALTSRELVPEEWDGDGDEPRVYTSERG